LKEKKADINSDEKIFQIDRCDCPIQVQRVRCAIKPWAECISERGKTDKEDRLWAEVKKFMKEVSSPPATLNRALTVLKMLEQLNQAETKLYV